MHDLHSICEFLLLVLKRVWISGFAEFHGVRVIFTLRGQIKLNSLIFQQKSL